MEKWLLNSFDISRVSVIVNPLILSDVTDVFPDFRDVNSLIVCQVFRESPVCSLKLFWVKCEGGALVWFYKTLRLTKRLEQKLQVFMNKSLRNISRIWLPRNIGNTELWRPTGQ